LNACASAVSRLLVAILMLTPPFVLGQSTRSKSDKNIDAIGHRNIARGPDMYSLGQEKQLGENLAKKVAKSSKFATDVAIMDYLERVDQKVERNSDKHIPMTLHLIDSDNVSAYTLLGGQQFVTRGLLLHLDSEGELASLLAHAIATTALRSDTMIATKLNIMQISSVPLDQRLPVPSPSSGMPIGAALEGLTFRRNAVFDADYFGVQYVFKSGYDPKCFTEFVQLTGDSVKSAPDTFSAYPPLSERLRALQSEIGNILPKRDGAVVSTPEFQRFKNQLQAMDRGGDR
jgi:beta-barrel assembly-enhancing protease